MRLFMRTERGTTRIAFVGDERTIKVPSCWYCRAQRFSEGWYANQLEARFSPQLRGIVVPTRSLCGGLFVVQPTTQDISFPPNSRIINPIEVAFREAIGDGDRLRGMVVIGRTSNASHTFEKPCNFGILDGNLLFRDFGSPGVIALLLRHCDAIQKAFAELLEAAQVIE